MGEMKTALTFNRGLALIGFRTIGPSMIISVCINILHLMTFWNNTARPYKQGGHVLGSL